MTDLQFQEIISYLQSLDSNVKLIATVSLFALLWWLGSKVVKSYLFKI